MSLIRDPRLVAINDLIVACREAANRHETAASLSLQGPLASALSTLSRNRKALADALAEIVLAEDDIPNVPSGEKELASTVIAHIKFAIAQDEVRQLLRDCVEKEQMVADAANALLGYPLPHDLRHWVAALCDDGRTRIDCLARAHSSD